MKQFQRHKDASEIQTQCAAAGIQIDSTKHEAGGDHLIVTLPGPSGVAVPVLFNVVSGRFFYAPKNGEGFNSDQDREHEPWFVEMLDFFYSEEAVI